MDDSSLVASLFAGDMRQGRRGEGEARPLDPDLAFCSVTRSLDLGVILGVGCAMLCYFLRVGLAVINKILRVR